MSSPTAYSSRKLMIVAISETINPDDSGDQRDDKPNDASRQTEGPRSPDHLTILLAELTQHPATEDAHQQHADRGEDTDEKHDPGQNLPDGADDTQDFELLFHELPPKM
jgi:hypothetical protein